MCAHIVPREKSSDHQLTGHTRNRRPLSGPQGGGSPILVPARDHCSSKDPQQHRYRS